MMRKRKRNNWMKTLESPQKGGMRPLKSKKSIEYSYNKTNRLIVNEKEHNEKFLSEWHYSNV